MPAPDGRIDPPRPPRFQSTDAEKTYDNAQYILNPVKIAATTAAAAVLAATALARSPLAQSGARTAEPPDPFAPMASVVNGAIGRRELPGAVVFVGLGDRVIYHAAFGNRAVQPAAEPMTEDTMFDVASLTKVVATTTSVMQLVEQGRIRLLDPVAHFIPEFGRNGKDRITIRQLLTHTSGLRPDLDLEAEFTGADEAIRRAADETPAAPPDERFIYSDINFSCSATSSGASAASGSIDMRRRTSSIRSACIR